MKIICTQENLKTGLSLTGRIISSTNTLPILNNILLKTEDGVLKISSTNLEIAITTQVRCKVEEDGSVAVANKTFSDLINNLPNKNINLSTKAGELMVETDNYHTSIKTLSAEEFPLIPKVQSDNKLVLNAQDLKKTLDQVVFAASTNQTQPEISGIFLSLQENGEARVAATDRYRLAEKIQQTKNNLRHEDVIIPQKTALEASRIIGVQKGDLSLMLNETQISIVFNETEIISRLIDGQYPDYAQIIPATFSTTAILEKQSLLGALKTEAIFSQNNNSVKFEISNKNQALILTAESSELGKGVVDLPANVQGPDGVIIFNHRYVSDCLSSIDTKNVIIKIIDDNSPGLIVPEGENNYRYLVMPIKS